jgi:hypothetical protein
VRRLALAVLLVGCDTVTTWVTDHGTVYRCESGADCGGKPEEWCWDGDEAELEQLLGAECHDVGVTERAWPAIVGCSYCCGDGCPRGANAHCGTACR